jgi:hypothetical protein
MNFTNSTDYFWALYDGDHLGTREHHPYVREFNLRWLSSGGVKPHTGQGCLKPENNIWTIAKNVRDDMEDIIPVLVTRNLAAESLAADVPDAAQLNRRLYFDQEWNTPFGEKEFVIVRKGGAVFRQKARYLSYRCIYNSQTFMTAIPGSQLPVLSYLTPSKEVTPSDAVYQACVTSKANAGKDYGYYWMRDVFGDGFTILKFFLLMGLISCVLIFFRVFLDKQLKASLSAMRPIYWILLWLAVTTYMCCPVIKYKGWGNLSMLIPVALACVFQVLGCHYMITWKQRNNNVDNYRMAFGFMLLAPVIALLCFATAVILAPLKYFLVIGLASGVFIFFRVSFDEKLDTQLSGMRPAYWLILWLAVTVYMFCPLMLFLGTYSLFVFLTLALAFMLQVTGLIYVVALKRRINNPEKFRTALLAILMAPVMAVLGVVFAAVVAPFFIYCFFSLFGT